MLYIYIYIYILYIYSSKWREKNYMVDWEKIVFDELDIPISTSVKFVRFQNTLRNRLGHDIHNVQSEKVRNEVGVWKLSFWPPWCHVTNKTTYCREVLFMRSTECYFDVYIPLCIAAREINTLKTLWCVPISATLQSINFSRTKKLLVDN